MTNCAEFALGRGLLAILFTAGAVQKAIDPDAARALLIGFGMPAWLVWTALAFNAVAALLLVANAYIRPVARALAVYCIATSVFHFVPTDPWQISIMVKNWALAGGCLILSACAGEMTNNSARAGKRT